MKKNIIVVTGGAGFVGSNLIKSLYNFNKYQIISLDNYSSGKKSNHIISKNVKYIRGETKNIKKLLNKYRYKINAIFHFGEFSRIFQSFKYFNKCYEYNIIGSKEVFNFCLNNKIKLIYSATSASFGNSEKKNLSPYAFTKSKNLELLENLRRWFNFKFEIIYFYNLYGENQISDGEMATVIGIFENQYKKNLPLTVVKPGSQKRRFTIISDTIDLCIKAWKKNKCKHYSISGKENLTILQVAKMFKNEIKFLPPRLGERYSSELVKMNLSKKVINYTSNKTLKKYIIDYKNKISCR